MSDPDASLSIFPGELGGAVRPIEAYMELVSRFMGKQAAALDEMRARYNAPVDADEVEFVAARLGGWGARLSGRALESSVDPHGCAAELVAEQDLSNAALVVLIGAGGGAVPLELCRALEDSPSTQVVVLEPQQQVLCELFKRTEGLEGLDASRVAFFSSQQSMMLHISRVFRRRGRLLVVCPPAYRQVYAGSLRSIFTSIEDGVMLADVNRNTHSTRSRQWVRNLLRNIQRRSEHPSLFALEGAFADVPAVLVAAGPSLDKNVHLLREVQDDVLIICVNTSLKALVRAGVKPHLVMSLESLNVSSHFKGDDEALQGVTLVLDETCHPCLFELPAERIYTFLESSPAFLAFAERAMNEAARGVCVGGSIANAAFSCANMLGCDPLILIGQDLAYTGNQVYASGTVFEDITLDMSGAIARLDDPTGIKQQILDDTDGGEYYAERSLFPVRSWDGEGTVMTSMDFNLFRYWFQEAGAQVKKAQGVTLINATEGGSYLEGFDHVPLADALGQYVEVRDRATALEAIIEERHLSAPRLPISSCHRAVEGAHRDCLRLKGEVEEAIERLDKALEALEDEGYEAESFMRRLIAFEEVEQTLGGLGRENSLVEACIQLRLNTILDSRNPLQESDDPHRQWLLHLEQSREVMEAILEGAEDLLGEMAAVLT